MSNIQKVFIRPSEIQSIYGISKSTAYRMMNKGIFPELVTLSTRCKGWRKADLDAHFKLVA